MKCWLPVVEKDKERAALAAHLGPSASLCVDMRSWSCALQIAPLLITKRAIETLPSAFPFCLQAPNLPEWSARLHRAAKQISKNWV